MFWNFNKNILNNVAFVDAAKNQSISYNELEIKSNDILPHLTMSEKGLVFLFCKNTQEILISYIALLKSGNACVLLDSKLNEDLKDNLIKTYKPDLILSSDLKPFNNYYKKIAIEGVSIFSIEGSVVNSCIHKNIAVLLSTSGTTGSPKLVKLSYRNIQSNAESIAEYLDITENERPITSLPMSYSYGLSVINSHLLKGATIVLTNESIVLRNFWNTFNRYECTSFAGVPYSYQLLQKTNFEKMNLPTLRTLTQAGGNLSERFQIYFAEYSKHRDVRFFVMYGQTEATARISYIPYEQLNNKFGSIGIAIPNGKLNLYSNNQIITEPGKEGELVYSGENVMLGYALNRASLSIGDEQNGILHTGDLGSIDADGYFYITGRTKRFIKIFGLRLNLDETERMLENHLNRPVACIGDDDHLKVFILPGNKNLEVEVRKKINELYKLHNSVIKVFTVQSIPVTASGKRDYKKMSILS